MKTLIIGAGKQGRGILAYICKINEIEYTFADQSEALRTAFASQSEYTIHLLSENTEDILMPCFPIVPTDGSSFYEEVKDATLIFTSTSNGQLTNVGRSVGAAFNVLIERTGNCPSKNIILCENAINKVAEFEEGLYETLRSEYVSLVKEEVGICEALSMSVSAQPANETKEISLDIWAQNIMRVFINKFRMKKDLLKIKGIHYVDNYAELRKQALYTNNTSSAFISYLGHLKGYQTLPEAMSDPQLSSLLDRCYQEVNDTLVKELGVSPKDQHAFSQLAKHKYQTIDDTIARHAKDVIRKLGKDERLAGICIKAMRNGILPDTIAIALAAALFYEDMEDEQSLCLKKMREEYTIQTILKEICEIEENSPLFVLVLQKVEWLKNQGYIIT